MISQGNNIRKSSFLSYATRGDCTLEPLAYGIHHRGVQLVDIVKDSLDKYMGKDRDHGRGLINMYPGIPDQLMDPWAVQKDSHIPEMRKMIQKTKFLYIRLFYRLFQNQE